MIRRQVNALAAEGREPDILVNLTNDGWFWGSSELDMHLVCGVFRAVECRKPLLVAANTGFSAWIDSDGNILQQGPRRDTGIILAQPRLDRRRSWYLAHGDWPAGVCLAACGLFAAVGLYGRMRGMYATEATLPETPRDCRRVASKLSPPVVVQFLNAPAFPLSRLLVDMRNWAKLY